MGSAGVKRRFRFVVSTGLGVLAGLALGGVVGAQEGADRLGPSGIEALRSLSLEELAQTPITAVSRRSEPIAEAAGAVYLITSEDIRRSGATTAPEVLRLAPNLWVAQDDASNYAISARGFNSVETANKLLVMVDGRSIYSPLYAGVFWNQNPVLLEDLDQIEVLSGPGGALWGSNAVNGVISIISKNSAETQGAAARFDAGLTETHGAARYGGTLGEGATYRVFVSGFDRDNLLDGQGFESTDGTSGGFAGFRSDMERGPHAFMLQGQLFENSDNMGVDANGGDLMARWRRDLDGGGNFYVRGYYDRADFDVPGLESATQTWDVSFRHTVRTRGRHDVTWGGGYRRIDDSYIADGLFFLDPAEDTIELGNLYAQDEISVSDALELTLGLKLEQSSYTGAEYLPSMRLAWTPQSDLLLWTAVSRAVRTPSRLDIDLTAPGIFIGGPNFESEEVIAYEAGYRGRPTVSTSISASLFYNDYTKLRTTSLSPVGGFPAEFLNGFEGSTYGIEIWGDYQTLDWWRLSAGLATLEKDFALEPGATDIASPPSTGADPDFQGMIRSRMDIGSRTTFDAWARWVNEVPEANVPAYSELNARLAWQITDDVELSLAGFNLLDESHPETTAEGPALEARRNVQLSARWSF